MEGCFSMFMAIDKNARSMPNVMLSDMIDKKGVAPSLGKRVLAVFVNILYFSVFKERIPPLRLIPGRG